jgi:hypothetical protein
MVDVLRSPRHSGIGAARDLAPGPRSGLARELRSLAEDLAGRPDRDELSLDEEHLLARQLDDAVAIVLPQVRALLEAELTLRVESLPLHARMALLHARQRREMGIE